MVSDLIDRMQNHSGMFFLLGSIICKMSEVPENKTLRLFLTETIPEYIEDVPQHWLEQESPFYCIQVVVAIVFLLICIPGNIGQLLVFVAYSRYLFKRLSNPIAFDCNIIFSNSCILLYLLYFIIERVDFKRPQIGY